jgi:hypothetical protein
MKMTTQSMTIKEFLSKENNHSECLSQLEQQQYDLLKLTVKASLIVATVLIPLHLGNILEATNGALQPSLEAYVNQFTPSQMIDVIKGVR